MPHKPISRRSLALAATSILFAVSPVTAADFWWRGDLSNNWTSDVVVLGNLIVNTNFATSSAGTTDRLALPGSGDVVRFASSIAGNLTTTLGSNFSISGLTTESTLPGNVTIGGSTLNFDFTSTGIVTSAPRTLTLNSTITSNTVSLIFNTANAASVVNLNSSFDGTASVSKRGPGTLNLNNSNTYSGATVVTGGTLNTNAADALSPGKTLTVGQSSTSNTALVSTGGFAQSISGLTLFARDSAGFVAVDVGAGTLTLTGNVALVDTQDAPGNNFGATIAAAPGGTLNLGGGVRNFTLAGQRFFQQELVISSAITNGGINLTANPSVADGTDAGLLLNATSPNTYTGGTTVNAGFLTVVFSTTLGPGALTLKTTGNVESGIRFFNAAQTLTSLQTGTLGTAAASLALNDTALTVNQSTNTTFAGSISGTGSLIKSGAGTLTLARANTYAGGTTLTAGTLTTAAANALPIGEPLTIGQASTAATAILTTGGFAQSISNLTLFARSGVSLVAVDVGAGTLTLTGNVALVNTQDFPGNQFGATIAAAPGGTLNLGGAVRNFTLAGQNIGQQELVVTPVITNGGINLTANPSTTVLNAAGMVLKAATPNTYTGGTTVNAGFLTVNATTTLGAGALTLRTSGSVESRVTLNNAVQTLTSLQTGSLGTGAATLALNATALTVNQSANTTFAGAIIGAGSLIKSGLGTLTLIGNNTCIGTTTITQGTLQIGNGGVTGTVAGNIVNNAALIVDRATGLTLPGRISGTGTLTKVGAGTLTLAPNQALPHLQSNLTILSGKIDLTNNDLLLNYTGTSPISALIAYLNSGQLTANDSFNGLPTTLAISEAVDLGLTTFGGIVVDDTAVVVKYTYVGDANLDGQVDALDYERVDLAIGNTGVKGTAQGDLNYDGNVDALDYEQIDLNIGNGVGSPLAQVFIPEPTLLAPLALAVLLAGRRRK